MIMNMLPILAPREDAQNADLGTNAGAFQMEVLWKYLALRILATKEEAYLIIRQATSAENARSSCDEGAGGRREWDHRTCSRMGKEEVARRSRGGARSQGCGGGMDPLVCSNMTAGKEEGDPASAATQTSTARRQEKVKKWIRRGWLTTKLVGGDV